MRPAICEATITSLPVTIPVSGISFPRGVVVRYTITEMANNTPTKTKNLDNFMALLPQARYDAEYSVPRINAADFPRA